MVRDESELNTMLGGDVDAADHFKALVAWARQQGAKRLRYGHYEIEWPGDSSQQPEVSPPADTVSPEDRAKKEAEDKQREYEELMYNRPK